MKKSLSIAIIVLLIASGILLFHSKRSTEKVPIEKCIMLCKEAKKSGLDLSNGPCLSDGSDEWTVKDWVCDVAHWPRKQIDNNPENQCQEFRNGEAHHFVEVDENCNFIRAY